MGFLDSAWSGLSDLFSGGGGGVGIGTSDILRDTAPSAADYTTAGTSSGFDWGSVGSGFADLGKGLIGAAAPVAGAGLAGLGINALMPGTPAKVNLVDPRQSQTIAGANMALDRARNIQANPTSFGLPGDPNDPNTPAGKKLYELRKGVRSADAARGAFNTGGSAERETNAINTAVGNEYNKVFQDSMSTLSAQPSMTGYVSPAKEDPWAQMLAGAVSPAVSKGLSSLLAQWGMGA